MLRSTRRRGILLYAMRGIQSRISRNCSGRNNEETDKPYTAVGKVCMECESILSDVRTSSHYRNLAMSGRTKAELYIHYYTNPLPSKRPLEKVETTSDTVVLPYPQWVKNKCACCKRPGPSGIWRCEFKGYVKVLPLCAACGLREAFAKWNGFFSPKLLQVDLLVTLTYESRQFTAEELAPPTPEVPSE